MKVNLSLLILLLTSGHSSASQDNYNQPANIDTLQEQPGQYIKNFSFENQDFRFSKVSINAFNVPENISLLIRSNTSGEQYYYSDIKDGETTLQSLDSNDITVIVNIPSGTVIPNNSKLTVKNVEFFLSKESLSNRALIGADNRKRLACYKGTNIYEWGLSSVVVGSGSGASIGSGNLFLTNHHVVGDVGNMYTENWFNWSHYECDGSNAVKTPLKLPTTQNVASGSQNNTGDWTLYKLHDFDFQNSEAKRLFGGLKLSNNNAEYNDPVVIPQYGNGRFQPTVVAVESDNKNTCNVTGLSPYMIYDCDTQSGSSGSSVLSAMTGEVVAAHFGAGAGKNYGVNISNIWTAADGIIKPEENIAVAPSLEPVYVHYLNASPFTYTGTIKTYDTPVTLSNDNLSIVHHETYSEIYANQFNEKNHQVINSSDNTSPLKMWFEQGDRRLPLDSNILTINNQPATLKYEASRLIEQTARSWIVLDAKNNTGETIGHEVIKMSDNWFDVMTPPFDPEAVNAVRLNLDISDTYQELWYRALNHKDGLLSFYPQQGPTTQSWNDRNTTHLPIIIENINTLERYTMYLSALKDTGLATYAMNDGMYAQAMPSFKIFYSPQLNTHLKSGVYRGILPLQTKHRDTQQVTANLLIDIDLTITAEDNTPPSITSNGAYNLLIGSEFIPQNHVQALDEEDGNITRSVTIEEAIDTSVEGVYDVTYRVTDSNGEMSTLMTYISVIPESDLATQSALSDLQTIVEQANEVINRGKGNCSDTVWNELIYMRNTANGVLIEPLPARYEVSGTKIMLETAINDTQNCNN